MGDRFKELIDDDFTAQRRIGMEHSISVDSSPVIFRALATIKPDWYFEDRETRDIPGLMRKVEATLDDPLVQEVFSIGG